MLCGRNKWIIKYLIVIFLSFGNAGLRLDAHHVCWRNWDLVTTSFRILHPVNPSLSPEQTLVQSISLSFLLPHPYVSFPSLSFSLSLCCSLSRQSLVWTDKGQLSTTHPNGTINPLLFFHPNQPPVTSAASSHNIAQMNGRTFMEREAKLMWKQI